MSFLSLAALWFAVSLPVVVLFYLLKRKRKVRLVSSVLLWQRFLNESRANAPFQKLKRSMLLLLQLLLLALAVLALARPYFADYSLGGALQVLVIDASASMQATDVSPSRFAAAQASALQLVDGLQDSDKMVIVLAGARTLVVQSPTSEKAVLRRTIEGLQVSDAPTRLLEGLQLAETLVKDHASSEIHLLSDGAVSDLGEFADSEMKLVFHEIGQGSDNIGVASLDVRLNPDDRSSQVVFASVVNFSTNDYRFPVELWLDDRMLEARVVDLEKGGTASQVFVAQQPTNGVFTFRIEAEDQLAIDNEAYVVSLLPQPAEVLLYSAGNAFLERALHTSGTVNLQQTSDPTVAADEFDLVVLDGLIPQEWPEANLLAFNVVHTNWFAGWERADAPAVVDWKSAHPLLRFVGFDEVLISEAWSIATPFWAESLVESAQFPLIVAGEQEGLRRVWIGFDVLNSTWPLRVSFPIFVANAVQWLNPSMTSGHQLTTRIGETLRLSVDPNAESVTLERPGGQSEEWPITAGSSSLMFGDTAKQGVYRWGTGTNQVRFAVNLLDAAESDINPRATLNLAGGRLVEATESLRADLELWRWFALAAIVVLMGEWWYYHKRTA